MIAALRGRILEKTPNRIVIDVQGVGYEVHVPLSTYYDLGDEGGEAVLRVYTHVREDALQLFGFLTDLERQMFERLISVSGIGPKLAVAVLSGLETRDLVAAVQRADVARLITIPGVGKKTAERIVLELKDRLMPLAVLPTRETAPTGPDRQRADLVSALQNLGYHRPVAEKAVDVVLAASPDAPFESALRNTLAELMKR
jgi:Holliday junction DNA helicase RuvA